MKERKLIYSTRLNPSVGTLLIQTSHPGGGNRGWVGFNPSIETLLLQTSHLVFVVVTLSPKFQSLDWEIIIFKRQQESSSLSPTPTGC